MNRCGKNYDNVMHRPLGEWREKPSNSTWRSVQLPVRSKGLICICQVKELEKYTPSRKNNMSELENWDPGKTEGEKRYIPVVGNEDGGAGRAR